MDAKKGRGPRTAFQWDDLAVFLAVARAGSFSKAARLMGSSQSTVTRRMQALEEGLGTAVVRRMRDGISLTEAGEFLMPLAESMSDIASEIEQRLGGFAPAAEGRVRVAMPEGIANFLVIPRLPKLHERHPGIEVDVLSAVELVDMARGEAELALRLSPPEKGPLTRRRVGTIRYSVFVPGTARRKRRRTLSQAQLSKLGWVTWAREFTRVPDALWLQRVVPDARCVVRLRSLVAIAQAASSGVGAALLPTTLGESLGGLERVLVREETPEVPLWLVGHQDHRNTQRVRAVADFLVEVCKNFS